jgi:hypothetical protein
MFAARLLPAIDPPIDTHDGGVSRRSIRGESSLPAQAMS